MVKALWLAAILLVQGVPPNLNSTFKVSGTIVREDNQAPDRILNADRVLLRGAGNPTIIEMGAGGAFEFTNVRPGTYQIVIGPMVTAMEPVTVTVTDKDVTGVRVLIPDVVVLRATVTVDGGGPLPRFQLAFARTGAPPPASAPINVTTAATFTQQLHSGQYRITSSGLPRGYTIKSMTVGTTDVMTQPLKLAAGEPDTMTVTLGVSAPPPWVEVAGRVTADEATSARVIRVAMGSAAAADVLTTTVDSDGSFEFSKVIPGSYTAIAFAATAVSTPVPLTVGTANVANLAIRLPQPKEITGRVAVQGNLPSNVPMPRVAFALAPIAGIPTSSANIPANPQPDGSFKIALPVGERQISVVAGTIPPGYKLASLTYGTIDLLKNPVRVAANDSTELRVNFDATAITPVSVSGRVEGLLTTQGVRVVLTNPVFGSSESSVSPDGSFAFSKVIPGNYNARLSLSGLSAGRAITVGNRDVTDVVITYPREFIVSGHIIVEGTGSGAASPEVVLEAKNAAGLSRTSNNMNNGVFMLSVKDGEYNISTRSIPAGYQIKSIMYGTTDLQKAPLKIDGPVTWEIILRLVQSSPAPSR